MFFLSIFFDTGPKNRNNILVFSNSLQPSDLLYFPEISSFPVPISPENQLMNFNIKN